MDNLNLLYKFIIIDRDTNDVVVKKTLRDVSDFINLVCQNKISQNPKGKNNCSKATYEGLL